jgi:hypothetical protein
VVEQALSTLSERIGAINHDQGSPYAISEAVAFGDFLSDQARVQAVNVGIRLTPEKASAEAPASATDIKLKKYS